MAHNKTPKHVPAVKGALDPTADNDNGHENLQATSQPTESVCSIMCTFQGLGALNAVLDNLRKSQNLNSGLKQSDIPAKTGRRKLPGKAEYRRHR
jgi:hypothetical protein